MSFENGFLFFISRKDDLIKTSGYRVSPTEVEEMLIEIGGVSNAVVFAKETDTSEQVIIAVLETDSPDVDEKEIIQECRKRLPGYMMPKEIHLEKSFKKTANSKVDRSYIRNKYFHK